MTTKLTLSIDKQVIEEAKKYANKEGRSLSNIVEEYLKSISTKKMLKQKDRSELDALINELCESVKLPKGKSHKELIREARIEKHLNR